MNKLAAVAFTALIALATPSFAQDADQGPEGPRMGRDGPPPPPGGKRWKVGPPDSSPGFEFETKGNRLKVRCSETETMKACVDASVEFFEKMKALKKSDE